MTKPRQRGFTLIELIIFIVVVSIGLAGILSVINTVVKSSADPMVRKQTIAIAESLLEEILLQNYNDPDGGVNIVESGRDTYDDVDDYNHQTFSVFPGLTGYSAAIVVGAPASVSGVTMKQVTVTVTHDGSGSLSLIGYRACYGEISCP